MNVKTNIMEKEQKEKLEKFLLTADELKKWLTDNDLDYIGGKIIERVCFSITKGKNYLCRKDVVMDSGEVAYREGVIYHSEDDGCLTDEQGTVGHVWTDGYAEYFVPYVAFEAGDWLWDDTLRIQFHVDEVFDEKYRLTDNTGKIYYKPKAEVEAVCRKFDVLNGAEQPSGNLDGLYLYKNTLDNGITVSLKRSSDCVSMEIVGLSSRQRAALSITIECFAKE